MPIILITGASNGIGFALTQYFIKAQYQVIATDIDVEKLKTLETSNLQVFKLDVTSVNEWQSISEKVEFIDIIINNAGVIIPAFAAKIESKLTSSQIDINLKGVINGSSFAIKKMLKQGYGHIINISSLAGVAPIQGLAIYAATKAAVRSFSLSIAFELKKNNINVSVICPDLVDTNMLTEQLEYPAAALTFSGNKILKTSDIVEAIVKRALVKKEVEILVPKSRGWLAKLGNVFPELGSYLTETLTKKGLKKIEKIKEIRKN